MPESNWPERLKKLRYALGEACGKKKLTQAEMADFLGVSRPMVYQWELEQRDPSPSIRRLVQLAEMIPPDQIKKAGLI